MSEEEILEGNILIGEFLGMIWINDDVVSYPNGYWLCTNEEDTDIPLEVKDWEFHFDWCWLMPVVERISKLGDYDIRIHLYGTELETFSDIIDDTNGDNLEVTCIHNNFNTPIIETIYQSVVEFIKYYNTQNK